MSADGDRPAAGRAVVFGGYGTFGSHVVAELAQSGVRVTVAGRQLAQAQRLAARMGPQHAALAADVRDRRLCLDALAGHAVAVNCAGPFSRLGTALLDACLEAGCHYVDIADDRQYAASVRGYGPRFAERGLTAAYGCSSLPSVSGALALLAHEGGTAPAHARITLFIGNNNPKGLAAVESAAGLLGRVIEAPQGRLIGFAGREVVELPQPFGRRAVLNFESPEYDLLPPLLGVPSVVVKVGFELALSTNTFGLLAAIAPRIGRKIAPALGRLGGLLRSFGTSGGAVLAELSYADGAQRRAALIARKEGQRMAALPCAYLAERLCRGLPCPAGAGTAYEVLGSQELIDRLTSDGFELHS